MQLGHFYTEEFAKICSQAREDTITITATQTSTTVGDTATADPTHPSHTLDWIWKGIDEFETKKSSGEALQVSARTAWLGLEEKDCGGFIERILGRLGTNDDDDGLFDDDDADLFDDDLFDDDDERDDDDLSDDDEHDDNSTTTTATSTARQTNQLNGAKRQFTKARNTSDDLDNDEDTEMADQSPLQTTPNPNSTPTTTTTTTTTHQTNSGNKPTRRSSGGRR